jgi:DNA-3-methyladenine glycosylase I
MHEDEGLVTGADGRPRCFWYPSMPEYHDNEWGRPLRDDTLLFEKICLEGFQSGMSWQIILRKREHFRVAFKGFDIQRVARFTEKDIERLLGDANIVRNRAKIVSAINNARRAIALIEEVGSLTEWVWKFAPAATRRPEVVDLAYYRANTTSPESIAMSKELKKRGWTFVGPTTIYALMQATGMVNDHLDGCVCRSEVEAIKNPPACPIL